MCSVFTVVSGEADVERSIISVTADQSRQHCEFWITDPPYAGAVNYHEITEFFIAWLRKNLLKPFDEWVWDSRRVMGDMRPNYVRLKNLRFGE